jgi:glycosyltransferase involved in cell wall biosynthesis
MSNAAQTAGRGTPLISVVMTTYREEWAKLKRAIDSIFAQTFTDLELVIVFEGIDPNDSRLVESCQDPRLVIDRQPQGIGRSRCHNAGLDAARGRYIARMDGDDYCYPQRLEVELAYLRAHPDVALVAAGGRLVDEQDNVIGERMFPESHAEIVRRMAFVNPILHPTVLWDRERTGYDMRYATYHVDDLELWLQMLEKGLRFANLPIVLLDYEQPPTRPAHSWRGVFWIRLLHWRLALTRPRYALGLLLFLALSLTPSFIIDAITRGNGPIDRLRSIQRLPAGPK